MSREPKIPIIEIFGPTIQGEGLMSGTVTHFLRTGGCGLRCTWCDSMHAVDPAQIRKNRTMMTVRDICQRFETMPYAPYVTFTGGDPAMQKHLGSLIPWFNMRQIRVAIETQGQMFPEWLRECDVITFSPKGPSSGNVVDPDDMIQWINDTYPKPPRPVRICIKVVVANKEDLDYAMNIYHNMNPAMYDAFYFTAVTPLVDLDAPAVLPGELPQPVSKDVRDARVMHRLMGVIASQTELANNIIALTGANVFNHKTHVGCQQHVLLWPEIEEGV